MIFDAIAAKWSSGDLDAVLEAFANGKRVSVAGLKGCATAFYLAQLQQHIGMPLVLVTSGTSTAEDLLRDITFFSEYLNRRNNTKSRIAYFPAYDTEPYQGVSPHPQISALRMQALWNLSQKEVSILILPVKAALQRIAPPDNFRKSVTILGLGENRGPLEIADLLRTYGYREKDLVTSR